jgi:hypothetical protein
MIHLPRPVPVARTLNAILRELRDIIVELLDRISEYINLCWKWDGLYLLTQLRRHSNLIILHQTKINTILPRHKNLPTTRLPTIQSQQPLTNTLLILDNFLNFIIWRSKLQLVPELRNPSFDQVLGGSILIKNLEIRRANGEDMGNKIRIPLSNTPDDCTTPVVAADDDLVGADLLADASYGVGVCFVGVVL